MIRVFGRPVAGRGYAGWRRDAAAALGVFPRVAGGCLFGQRTLRVDQSNPVGGIFLGYQAVEGDLGVLRVGVVGLAVSEHQLQGFGDRVDVLGAVVAHGSEVEVLQ